MTDKSYTNLDLDTAESMLVGSGNPEQAKAMRYYTQGMRNFIQGEFGQSFVDAFERVMVRHIGPLTTEIGGLRGDTAALQAEFRDGLRRVQTTVSTLAEAVDGLRLHYDELDKRDAAQYKETQRLFRESKERQERLTKELAALRTSFEEYTAGSRRGDVDELLAFKADVEGRIARALPEDETQQLIALLRQIRAERGGDERPI
jgi:hypothetical protein